MTTLVSLARVPSQCTPLVRLSFAATVLRAAALWRSRRALARLSAAQLDDIGLSVAEATREARRPIWDAPAHWYGR